MSQCQWSWNPFYLNVDIQNGAYNLVADITCNCETYGTEGCTPICCEFIFSKSDGMGNWNQVGPTIDKSFGLGSDGTGNINCGTGIDAQAVLTDVKNRFGVGEYMCALTIYSGPCTNRGNSIHTDSNTIYIS